VGVALVFGQVALEGFYAFLDIIIGHTSIVT